MTLAFPPPPDYGSGGGDVIEGCRETLRGRELVRVDLCHAALATIADERGTSRGLGEARSVRRSVRGGQNLSARRVGYRRI